MSLPCWRDLVIRCWLGFRIVPIPWPECVSCFVLQLLTRRKVSMGLSGRLKLATIEQGLLEHLNIIPCLVGKKPSMQWKQLHPWCSILWMLWQRLSHSRKRQTTSKSG
jgi:hypothetical protein